MAENKTKMPWRRHRSQIGHVSCQKIRHHNVPWVIFDNTAKSPMKVK
jgi:hypothetical protein